MAKDDDPRAPYKGVRGRRIKRRLRDPPEARRAQQQLESEAAGSEPQRNFIIRDNLERVVRARPALP